MQTLKEILSAHLRAAFQAAFPGADLSGLPLDALPAGDEAFGDYQCNGAMAAAKVLRLPPRKIAEQVAARIPADGLSARAEIAGPGFINLTLSESALARHLEAMQADPLLGIPQPGAGQTLILDYSSPNVAKPMHVAHIRSTVIGDALKRIHRALGCTVISDNHLGDWGTQFGKLIMGYRHFLDPAQFAAAPVHELERIYVLSSQKAEADPAWEDQCRAELVKLQAGDSENRALWRKFMEVSLADLARIYGRLGVSFELTRGESYYHDALPALIEKLQALGLVRESEGALVAFLDDEKLPPCIVRKSDGGYNYATTDLATVFSRVEEFRPDAIIYVTDERQQLHFRQFFAVAQKAGVRTPLRHVWFGLMRLPDGLLSTRMGNAIKLDLLLDEAEKRALEIVKTASPDMPASQQQAVARAVGIGAVKYADLSQNPQSAVTFTWEKALAMDGNSAPYLQYAHARIASAGPPPGPAPRALSRRRARCRRTGKTLAPRRCPLRPVAGVFFLLPERSLPQGRRRPPRKPRAPVRSRGQGPPPRAGPARHRNP